MKKNCKICAYFQLEEIGDSDYGAIYSEEYVCVIEKDLEESQEKVAEGFDRDTERECCHIDFWKVVDIDKEINDLFLLECEIENLFEGKAFQRCIEKYKVTQ